MRISGCHWSYPTSDFARGRANNDLFPDDLSSFRDPTVGRHWSSTTSGTQKCLPVPPAAPGCTATGATRVGEFPKEMLCKRPNYRSELSRRSETLGRVAQMRISGCHWSYPTSDFARGRANNDLFPDDLSSFRDPTVGRHWSNTTSGTQKCLPVPPARRNPSTGGTDEDFWVPLVVPDQ